MANTKYYHISDMKTKFRKVLVEKTKDFGLSKKALDELTEIGSQGLEDDASDEDISAKVDSVLPYAKAMQGETTRKLQKAQSEKSKSNEDGDKDGDSKNDDEMPSWFKPFQDELSKLKEENAALKTERAKSERSALIASEAKKLGIPEYLTKRLAFADDADIVKELAEYKQELVNNNLMPKDTAHVAGASEDSMKADAKAWAESLPSA